MSNCLNLWLVVIAPSSLVAFLLEASVHLALVPEPAATVPLVVVNGVAEEDGNPSPKYVEGHGHIAKGPGESCRPSCRL